MQELKGIYSPFCMFDDDEDQFTYDTCNCSSDNLVLVMFKIDHVFFISIYKYLNILC